MGHRDKIEEFRSKVNSFHPTIKFTAEISETETTFLDTIVYKGDRFLVYKGDRFLKESNLQRLFNTRVMKGFIKGEALMLLRTNSSRRTFETKIRNFAARFKNRGYPASTAEKHLSEVNFTWRETSLKNRNRTARKKILPFVTQYHPRCLT